MLLEPLILIIKKKKSLCPHRLQRGSSGEQNSKESTAFRKRVPNVGAIIYGDQ